jgi:ABC-type sugar transport system substrate-binding protein
MRNIIDAQHQLGEPHMRTIKTRTAVAGAAALVLMLAGCGHSDSDSPPGSSSDSGISADVTSALAPYLKPPTSLVVNTPLSKTPPKGKKVVLLSNGIEIVQETGKGIEAAAHALGWSYRTSTVDANNPATINSAMLAAIGQGADVVMLTATDVSIYANALAEARKRGTLIIDIASGNKPTDGITALVNNAAQNGPVWGKLVALGVLADAQKAGTEPKIAIVTAPVFDTILGPTNTAAKDTVSQYCSSCSVATVNISANDLFSGKASADIVSYLQRHPDVNYLALAASVVDEGLRPALQAAGLDKVKIFGVAPLGAQMKSLSDGQESGWVADPLNVMGWMAVDAAARAFTKDDPTVYNDVGIPSYLVTKDTAAGGYEVPTDYQNQFKKMWGLAN